MSQDRRHSSQLQYQLAGSGALKSGGAPAMLALVVDDDADITRFVGAVLSTSGVTTVAAYDAIQGFMVAQRQRPRLIFVDWHMPAGGGPQLLRKLRDSVRTSAIPVYVITADDSVAILPQAEALGARAVLRKPLDPAALLAIAAQLLQ
jgi:two-component system chemotaxis response regulator CheY